MRKNEFLKKNAFISDKFIAEIKNYNMSENYGSQYDGVAIDTSLIHEICNKINTMKPSGKGSHTKLKLFVELFKKIPDYSILIYMRQNYNTYSVSSKKYYWRTYRKWMNCDLIYSNPVKYSMECDWFTDKQSWLNAWKKISRTPLTRRLVLNIVDCYSPLNEEIKDNFKTKHMKNKNFKSLFI